MAKKSGVQTADINAAVSVNLQKWNLWLAVLYLAQGIFLVLLSVTSTFPVQTSYLTLNSIASEVSGSSILGNGTRHLFDLNIVWVVALSFLVAAAVHGLAGTVYRKKYEADLRKNANRLRWTSLALTSGLMMTAIIMLSGVAELSTLLLVFALQVIASVLWFMMETHNQGKTRINWLAYRLGCVAAALPWVVVLLCVYGAATFGTGGIPGFMYGVYATTFLLLGAMAVMAYLQHRKTGKWQDHLFAERAFMIAEFCAISLFAWQIFLGALRP